MTECILSDKEIRKLNRDLRILIATDGTLTRILNVVADDEVVVQIMKQQIHDDAPKMPEFGHLAVGRILQRHILLKGRNSGHPLVAAESLIAIDRLPPTITTNLTETNRPIGEIMTASCIESCKETAKVWVGELPVWLSLNGHQNSRRRIVARRYRVIVGGQPVIVITEHFLRSLFQDSLREESDYYQYSNDITVAR